MPFWLSFAPSCFPVLALRDDAEPLFTLGLLSETDFALHFFAGFCALVDGELFVFWAGFLTLDACFLDTGFLDFTVFPFFFSKCETKSMTLLLEEEGAEAFFRMFAGDAASRSAGTLAGASITTGCDSTLNVFFVSRPFVARAPRCSHNRFYLRLFFLSWNRIDDCSLAANSCFLFLFFLAFRSCFFAVSAIFISRLLPADLDGCFARLTLLFYGRRSRSSYACSCRLLRLQYPILFIPSDLRSFTLRFTRRQQLLVVARLIFRRVFRKLCQCLVFLFDPRRSLAVGCLLLLYSKK